MSSASASAQGYRDDVADRLRDEGHQKAAEWVEGFNRINEFELSEFLELVDDAWVVQLVGAETTYQFTRATNGDLIMVPDTDQNGEFGIPR